MTAKSLFVCVDLGHFWENVTQIYTRTRPGLFTAPGLRMDLIQIKSELDYFFLHAGLMCIQLCFQKCSYFCKKKQNICTTKDQYWVSLYQIWILKSAVLFILWPLSSINCKLAFL